MSVTGSDGEMEAQKDEEHLRTFMKRIDWLQNAPSLPTRLPAPPKCDAGEAHGAGDTVH